MSSWRRWHALALAALTISGYSYAQTAITASHISMGGKPIAVGTAIFTPVDVNNKPIAFVSGGGGGLNGPKAFSCTIAAGALSGCQVPDACLTTPANILYTIRITATGNYQSFEMARVANICGATWALDDYAPPAQTTNVQPIQVSYGTAAPPNPCATPSFYIRNFSGGQLYMCVAGVPVLVTDSGGAVASVNGHTGVVTLGAADVSADASGAAATAQAAAIASAVSTGLQKSGGTMTGPIVLPGDPTQALHASTKQYVDAHAGATNIGQLAGVSQTITTSRVVNPLSQIANSDIAQNHFRFTDGTDLWSAGINYVSLGTFIDDAGQAMLDTPSYFTPSQVLNYVTKFIAAKDGSGNFPIVVSSSGGSPIYFSAMDSHHAHVTGDGWIMVPQLLYLYYQKTGDLTPYTANVAAIKTALALIPRNGSTHLITVNAGDEYIPGFAFLEYMRFTGDVANASVWYARVCQVMALMATAAGDSTNATFFNSEYSTVVASIKSTLIDGTTGLLKAATGQNSTNLDVVSSSLATYFEMLTTAQETAISTYLSTNFATLTNSAGYILQSPTVWATVGTIPAGGGAPYGATYGTGQYQGGYWSYQMGWFDYALAKTDLAHATALLKTYRDGPDPTLEWYDRGTLTPPTAATSLNLVSATGPALAAMLFPSALSVPAGIPLLNQFGVPVNLAPTASTTCSITGSILVNIGTTALQIPTCGSTPPAALENWLANETSGTNIANTADAGNPATATNVTRGTTSGFPGTIAQYNGTTSVAFATNSTNTNFDGTTPFSVSAWIYPTAGVIGTNYRLMSTLDVATTLIPGWDFGLIGSGSADNISVNLISNIANNLITVNTSTTLSLNAIHNACFTYDGSKTAAGVNIYIDGTLASMTTASNTLTGSIASPVPVALGALHNGAAGASFFQGSMGYNRIYNNVANCAAIFAAGPI